MKNIPVLVKNKKDCTGCCACMNACPKGAVKMTEDKEGFPYPEIDESLCIGCSKCLLVCPCAE